MKTGEQRDYKARIDYAVRDVSNTAEGATCFGEGFVPYIVNRPTTSTLDEVVAAAIDRGLIGGMKQSAAKEVAAGIMAQVMAELREGRGVAFGRFFTARPFLLGTTDAAGTLTDANELHVKLAKGEDFDLDRGDFRWHFTAAAARPKIAFAISDAAGAVKNVLQRGATIRVHGGNLTDALGPSVFTLETADGATIVLAQTGTTGAYLVDCAWPEGEIAAGDATIAVKTSTGRTDSRRVKIA